MPTNARLYLVNLYLEWVNDFLTVTRFAEHHGLTIGQATALIALARTVASTDHPDF